MPTPHPVFRAVAMSLWLVGVPAASAGPAGSRPNVILVISDDQGYGEIAAHGNSIIRTPHLDRLHGQSVRLTNFHVDPTCSPTRSALLTGRYSSRTGVWHTIAGRSLMRSDEQTLAEALRSAGYRTGMFGKWHLGDNYPLRAQDQGFDDVFCHGGGGVGQTPDFWGNDYFDDTYLRNGRPERVAGYCTDVWFEHALRFVEAHRERPFFLYLATNAPHAPYRVPEKYAEPYRNRQVNAEFYGMITNLDENLGRLLTRLDEGQLAENTIVVFMTDNGSASPAFNAGMRGRKGSEYEGGHRVPFLVRWPAGGIGGGRDADRLTAHIDVLPTILDLCGVDKPAGPPIDGRSLAPLLRQAATEFADRTLFVHSQRIEQPQKWRASAVMTQRFRLINGRELYDIAADPAQATDIASQRPDVVARLRSEYDAWWSSISERFGETVRVGIGFEAENPARLTAHDWHGENTPWSHDAIRRMPWVNGYWAVQVARDGDYEFTLRHQPDVAEVALQANTARVRLGDVEATAPVPASARSVAVRMRLRAGPASLQTWLTDTAGRARGAFFLDARYIGP
jgi:arylsulfatase A-like enzyme